MCLFTVLETTLSLSLMVIRYGTYKTNTGIVSMQNLFLRLKGSIGPGASKLMNSYLFLEKRATVTIK